MNNLSRGARFAIAGGMMLAATLVDWAGFSRARATEIQQNGPQMRRFEFAQVHMGMQFRVILYCADEARATRGSTAAFERIAELDRVMSDYDPDSELSRLSATAGSGQAVAVSTDLWNVLLRSQKLSAASDGAFDVTVGPYVKLWRRARRSKEMPPPERLDEARRAVGYRFLKLDPAARTATLVQPGMRLDLGGIAVGYAVDDAMQVLRKHGLGCALIDGSGDMLAGDPPPGEAGWRVGFGGLEADAPPSMFVNLRHAAVTSAGDSMQFVEIDGKRYSHIVDPRTGLGITEHSLVVVLAKDCLTADSLDTAVSVLGPRDGLPLIEQATGAAAIIWHEVDGKIQVVESKRAKEFDLVRE